MFKKVLSSGIAVSLTLFAGQTVIAASALSVLGEDYTFTP